MAINLYSPLLRKDHVDARLELIEQKIADGLIYYMGTIDDTEIEQKIRVLQDQEDYFFDLLNINGTKTTQQKMQELNKRVERANLNLGNLNGSMIQEQILDICSAAYHERLLKFLQEEMSKGSFGDELKDALQTKEWKQAFIGYLNKHTTTKTGQSGRLKIKTKGLTSFHGDFEELTAKELTYTAKERMQSLVEQHLKQQGINVPIYQYLINKTSVQLDPMDWTGMVKGLTEKQAKTLLDDDELKEVNDAVKELIVQYAQAPNPELLRKVVNLVIRTNKYAFFVGKNLKAITGLLGEIQGLYYLSVLTDTDPDRWYPEGSGELAKMQWVADIRRGKGSKKASIDILLDNIGIQVKNTTRDITDDFYNTVDFSGGGITLNALAAAIEMEQSEFIDAVSSLYQTYGFNIEYQTENGKYIAADNADFVESRQKMDSLIKMAERLFGVWMECAMHMGANKSFESALEETNANSIYFINGLFYSSSEILTMLYDALKKGTKSGVRMRAIMPNKGTNIVSYLNDKKRKQSI